MLRGDFLGKKILEGRTPLHRFDSGSTPATPLRVLLAGMLIVTVLGRPSQCRNWVLGIGFPTLKCSTVATA